MVGKLGLKKKNSRNRCRWITKKIHQLPVEILANIFDIIPREELTSVSGLCKSFQIASGLIVRQDFCKYRNKLEEKLKSMIQSLRSNGLMYNDACRWDLCQKIGYLRIMKQKMTTLEAVVGNPRVNVELWNMLGIRILSVVQEQESLLKRVLNFPYFLKDIRPRYVNSNMICTQQLFHRYFFEIDPTNSLNSNEPYCVQMFNLLNTCQSANVTIVAFHPSRSDYSIVNMCFGIRGLGPRFTIDNFNDYKDPMKPMNEKLSDFKYYLYRLLELENSEFLFYQMEQILNLESYLEYPNGVRLDERFYEHLENAYDTFLFNTYNEISNKKTKFYSDNTIIYRDEITRQQEIKSCVSNVVINLKFVCDRKYLPEMIAFSGEDMDAYEEINPKIDKHMIPEYLSTKEIVLGKSRLKKSNRDITSMVMDVQVSHSENSKSLIVVFRKLQVVVNKNGMSINILNDDKLSRFGDIQCECHANGSQCNDAVVVPELFM